jgi:hypothetical protein
MAGGLEGVLRGMGHHTLRKPVVLLLLRLPDSPVCIFSMVKWSDQKV